MPPLQLERLFERLWGENWRTGAREELGVDNSTLTRWVNGTMEPHPVVFAWARERQLRWEREQKANRRRRAHYHRHKPEKDE